MAHSGKPDFEVADLNSLVRFLVAYNREAGTSPIFRGQPDRDDYRLQPTIFRSDMRDSDEVTMMHTFRAKGWSRSWGVPNPDDYTGWLMLAQHHGLPTRLLDWTACIGVAAFFAVENSDAEKHGGAIWVLNYIALHSRNNVEPALLSQDHLEVGTRANCAFRRESLKREEHLSCIAITPRETCPRLAVQEAAFTLHSAGEGLEEGENAEGYLFKIRIPSQVVQGMRHSLSLLGLNRMRLFPDLDNLAREIKLAFRS